MVRVPRNSTAKSTKVIRYSADVYLARYDGKTTETSSLEDTSKMSASSSSFSFPTPKGLERSGSQAMPSVVPLSRHVEVGEGAVRQQRSAYGGNPPLYRDRRLIASTLANSQYPAVVPSPFPKQPQGVGAAGQGRFPGGPAEGLQETLVPADVALGSGRRLHSGASLDRIPGERWRLPKSGGTAVPTAINPQTAREPSIEQSSAVSDEFADSIYAKQLLLRQQAPDLLELQLNQLDKELSEGADFSSRRLPLATANPVRSGADSMPSFGELFGDLETTSNLAPKQSEECARRPVRSSAFEKVHRPVEERLAYSQVDRSIFSANPTEGLPWKGVSPFTSPNFKVSRNKDGRVSGQGEVVGEYRVPPSIYPSRAKRPNAPSWNRSVGDTESDKKATHVASEDLNTHTSQPPPYGDARESARTIDQSTGDVQPFQAGKAENEDSALENLWQERSVVFARENDVELFKRRADHTERLTSENRYERVPLVAEEVDVHLRPVTHGVGGADIDGEEEKLLRIFVPKDHVLRNAHTNKTIILPSGVPPRYEVEIRVRKSGGGKNRHYFIYHSPYSGILRSLSHVIREYERRVKDDLL
mmetsp:Transcript_21326/g.55428  ORF Transcript_21326/g.55428 Transcript_21326/m.55428 type:complete len:589 (-) Transcript_21326:1693-3459(-)